MTTLVTADLGSSLIKVIFTGKDNQPEPIAIRPEVVSVTPDQIKAQLTEYIDDPLRSMFVEVGGQFYALGDFALSLNAVQYHELGKWDDLIPKVLGVLGLVAYRLGTHHLDAYLCLMMPLTEAQAPNRGEQIKTLTKAAQKFRFRGQIITTNLTVKMNVEGSGLYAGYAAYLRSQGQFPEQMDIPVIMGGERNTSLLCYRGGKLSLQQSGSTSGGFYQYANQGILSIGAQMKLSDLIRAIATGKQTVRVAGNEVIDISAIAQNATRLYGEHLIKLVRAKLPTGDISVVAGGGALKLVWEPLQQWFEGAGIEASYLSPLIAQDLNIIFARHPSLASQKERFADAVGSYRTTLMATKSPVVTAS